MHIEAGQKPKRREKERKKEKRRESTRKQAAGAYLADQKIPICKNKDPPKKTPGNAYPYAGGENWETPSYLKRKVNYLDPKESLLPL